MQRRDDGGLTTLCLKPFMTATGANARQAVRRSDGEVCGTGGALESGGIAANSANAARASGGRRMEFAETEGVGSDRHGDGRVLAEVASAEVWDAARG
jgi:hypothetical protein